MALLIRRQGQDRARRHVQVRLVGVHPGREATGRPGHADQVRGGPAQRRPVGRPIGGLPGGHEPGHPPGQRPKIGVVQEGEPGDGRQPEVLAVQEGKPAIGVLRQGHPQDAVGQHAVAGTEGSHGVQAQQVCGGAGLPQQPVAPGGQQVDQPFALGVGDQIRLPEGPRIDTAYGQQMHVGEGGDPLGRHRRRDVPLVQRRPAQQVQHGTEHGRLATDLR